MSTWQYKIEEKQHGPVSFQELAGLLREGKVVQSTHVCRSGTMNWEPAWRVPGLLRAAGIVEAGDSPAVEAKQATLDVQTALTPALSQRTQKERERATEGQSEGEMRRPRSLSSSLSLVLSVFIGVLAVGFFYRWASQAMLAFPMPPTVVDGELINCYFPLVGRCTMVERGLLYLDVFGLAAVATWYAVGQR